jgi:cytochrome b pre-mRNA-processing protein 3
MLSSLFRGATNRKVIDRIHGEIVAAARDRALFTDYGIEDTLEGRFEAVVLLSAIVVHKLQALPDPAHEVAQDVTDALFRQFDAALREMGVGDTTVPKRMKTIAEAYLGRVKAYQDAFAKDRLALAPALSRNVYAGKNDGVRLARYVGALSDRLEDLALEDFLNGPIPFPKPRDIG